MTPDAFTAGRLRCPACGYLLHNLPNWYTCPECGFPYDPYAKVHTVNERGRHIASLLRLAAWAVFFTFFSSVLRGPPARTVLAQSALYAFYGFLLLMGIRPLHRLIRDAGRPT